MKKLFARCFVLAMVNSVFAQQIPDRKVFATAGKDLKNLSIGAPTSLNNKITFTMGEPIMGLITLSGKRLNIGFIQPDGISLKAWSQFSLGFIG
jgi:hypothetical protein